MILTDRMIREAHEKGEIEITPFEDKQVQPASYDLRIGERGITTSSKKLTNIKNDGYLAIKPGDLAIINSLEAIKLNAQHTGRIGLRSKFARKGLIATTGPQIDPGYHGRLIVGVTNLSPTPISLPFNDDFISIELHRLEEPAVNPYNGPYQGKLDLGPEEIATVTEGSAMALSEVISTLQSLSANVAKLSSEMTYLKWGLPLSVVVIGIIVGIK